MAHMHEIEAAMCEHDLPPVPPVDLGDLRELVDGFDFFPGFRRRNRNGARNFIVVRLADRQYGHDLGRLGGF
jgi:hypothetical protein